MKRLEIIRNPTADAGTFGVFVLPWGNWQAVSLELPWRDNEPRYSCIPPGIYYATLDGTQKWSPRPDGQLYHVRDVPGRSLIKIHAATWAGDEKLGLKADLLGCIAPGAHTGRLQPQGYPQLQACILESRKTLTRFMELTDGEPLEVLVRWLAGAEPTEVV